MSLINKEQLLSDIVNLPSPLGISSNGVDSTYMEGYLTGKAQRQFEIIDIINKQQTKKPKRKFRAMTNAEFCRKWEAKHNGRCFGKYEFCPLYYSDFCQTSEPYKTKAGKYILIEVKE